MIKSEKYELMNIDCMDFMRTVPDKYFELAIVDPPFGLGDKMLTNGGTWAVKWKGSAKWDIKPEKEYFEQLFRISKNQIIWGGQYFIEFLYSTRCFIIWDKIAQMDSLADCEFAWTSFNENAKIFRHIRNATEKRIHLTQKPIKLYEFLLNKFADKNMKIFDSHLGSGSIVIACIKYNLHITGCEISEHYFNAAKQRILNYESQKKLEFDC